MCPQIDDAITFQPQKCLSPPGPAAGGIANQLKILTYEVSAPRLARRPNLYFKIGCREMHFGPQISDTGFIVKDAFL